MNAVERTTYECAVCKRAYYGQSIAEDCCKMCPECGRNRIYAGQKRRGLCDYDAKKDERLLKLPTEPAFYPSDDEPIFIGDDCCFNLDDYLDEVEDLYRWEDDDSITVIAANVPKDVHPCELRRRLLDAGTILDCWAEGLPEDVHDISLDTASIQMLECAVEAFNLAHRESHAYYVPRRVRLVGFVDVITEALRYRYNVEVKVEKEETE